MSKRGDAGVAKVEGLVIFVAGTKVGDTVKIRITKSEEDMLLPKLQANLKVTA